MNSSPGYDVAPLTSQNYRHLRILRQHDTARSWNSLDDQRVCVLCGQEFRGRDIHLQADRDRVAFHCPTRGCRGQLRHFVFPGNPLLDPKVWDDWMLALEGADAPMDEVFDN